MNTTSKLFGILSFILISLILACQTSYAAGVAGQVQFAFGNVQITTAAGDTHALKKGDSVNEGDTVFTAISSSAQIKMKDGGFIAIRPDTNMKFDKFVFNGTQDGAEKGFFSLFKGGFRAVTGLIGKVNKQNYKIFTKAATVGIRGTDHEVFFVPEGNPLAPSGAYSKVNVGETTLTTGRGTVNVLPNQMGFASGMNAVPKVVPINTQLFTVAVAPTKTVKERKAEQSKQAGTSSQGDKQSGGQAASQGGKQDASASGNAGESTAANTGSSSSTGSASSSGSAANTGDSTTIRVASSDSAPLLSNNSVTMLGGSTPMAMQLGQPTLSVQLLVPIILTNATTGGTLNSSSLTYTVGGAATTLTGGTSIVSLAYAGNHVAVESTNFNTWGSLVSPADLVYVAGGSSSSGALSSYTELNIGGGSNWTYSASITGGTANSFNAPSFASTGIQYGYWTGYTAQTFTNTYTLGGTNGGSSIWMYGPQGYIDSTYLNAAGTAVAAGTPMYGTFTYQMDGGNAPQYQNSGVSGKLTSASITANFAAMTVSASLGLTMPGNDIWGANVSNLAISAAGGGAFYGYASPGSSTNTMTVTHGVGTATTCSTCSGNLSGMFTGQNFSGAMISYLLSDTAQGGTLSGDAALTRNVTGNTTVTNNTAAPTGQIVIDNGQGSLFTYSSGSVVTTGNVLTQYGSGSTNLVTISNCSTCSATASGSVSTSGIYYGTWTSGTYSSTYGGSTAGYNGTSSTVPAYWITGPEAGPLYLPQALVGTASYALDAGQVTNSAGVAGTVKGTTALSVNFTNQTVGVNLDATISGHTWNASTVTAAPLMGNQGIGGAAFHFTTSTTTSGKGNYNGYGTLSVAVNGVSSTSNWGYIDGQLTGSGLTGAIVSFNLYGSNVSYSDTLNGVAAFTGTAQNINTPYQSILVSTYDTVALVPTLGFYANNSSRVSQDASGNLTKFDSQSVASGNSNNSVTLTNVGSTLTDHGTDPVTGISWGRWTGGTLNATNRATGAVTATALTGSLHWIAEPVATTAVTLPISGTYTYNYAGGTKPTDNLGNVGTLNSATLSANFTAQTVNLGVNTTVNGGTLNATGTNAPIIQNTVFYASSQEPSSSSSYLKVTCTGTCGTTTGGTVIGKFTGAGATGVAMSYGLQNGSSVVNGVAAFHR